MNIQGLAKSYLKDALTKGAFVLPESGEVKEFTASEILNLAKYVLKEGIILDESDKVVENYMPSEFTTEDFPQIELPLDTDIFESLPNLNHEGK